MSTVLKGLNKQVHYENGYVVIKENGLLSGRAEVRIPLEKISHIHLQKQSNSNGYINFVLEGNQQALNTGQARKDPTCVLMYPVQYKKFLALKVEVERQMIALQEQKVAEIKQKLAARQEYDRAVQRKAELEQQLKAAQAQQMATLKTSNEAMNALKKLSELKAAGIITEEEFEERKKAYMSLI